MNIETPRNRTTHRSPGRPRRSISSIEDIRNDILSERRNRNSIITSNDNVSLGVSEISTNIPESNLFHSIPRIRINYRRNRSAFYFDNLAELKRKKKNNGKCPLCQKTTYTPCVSLDCNHKYHLQCFMILNDSDELLEQCLECGKKININLKEVKTCSICLEKLIDDDIEIELPCKHRFHIYCIQKWVDINKNCPLCRKTF